MRYIKKLALYTKNPVNNRLSVLPDDRIVTNSVTSLQVPTGTTSQRPEGTPVTGTIRYNTTFKEFEVYNADATGPTKWEFLRTIRQSTIVVQDLGYGNYVDTIFGPLSYDVDIAKPQNVLVFVDNVWQAPTTNYTLTTNPSSNTSTVALTTASGVTTLYLNTLTNIDIGTNGNWREISAPSGIQSGTTITNISTSYNIDLDAYAVEISLPTTGIINSGTEVTVSYPTGTYIEFTGFVPAKPVVALLGFDGYFPAGPNGTAWQTN